MIINKGKYSEEIEIDINQELDMVELIQKNRSFEYDLVQVEKEQAIKIIEFLRNAFKIDK
ncbi:hypothetical protein [uncultured Clostridium sp.]|uniref:hypothetical protein n=1 Tax=uncultured Clostridium sp. TaxID=59620 RepID=UPI0026DC8C38|nr:hypothetical protein [uncultured Clostridium sp.]